MKTSSQRICTIAIIFIFLITPVLIAEQQEAVSEQNIISTGIEYKGHLRISIVEIESRWKMENRQRYEYALFDYAYNDPIEIHFQDTFEETIRWEGDVSEDNIIIIAALYNANSERAYADPPIGRPFDAYYIDAAAGVKPGETESNTKTGGYTHTVVCEVGTATWCPACPTMARELIQVYESGEYPFYFMELVTDESSDADRRTDDFNLKWLPTAFYDGGDEVVVGGGNGADYHEEIIETIGKRDVHDLDFTLSTIWVEDSTIDINITITNNEALPNNPPEKPTITGSTTGAPGDVLEYRISTTDPENDDIYYMIDWADNTSIEWIGPFDSGETITVVHSWVEKGEYLVQVKAKDPDGEETDWATLTVTMPRQKNLQHILLERVFTLHWIQQITTLLGG